MSRIKNHITIYMKNVNGKKIYLLTARTLVIFVVAALALMGTAMGEISRTGLVGEWHFNGDAKDSSGNGNDGTIYSATFVDGKFGKALSFNGMGDYVEVPDSTSLNISNEVSLAVWIKPTLDAAATWQAVISKGKDRAENYVLFIDNGGMIRTQMVFSEGGSGLDSRGGTVKANEWQFIVMTYRSGEWKHYVNGIATAAKPQKGTLISNNIPLTIGLESGTNYYFSGLIDEVRIYSRALSADEVKANYEAEKANYEAGQTTVTSSPTQTVGSPAATPRETAVSPAATVTAGSPATTAARSTGMIGAVYVMAILAVIVAVVKRRGQKPK